MTDDAATLQDAGVGDDGRSQDRGDVASEPDRGPLPFFAMLVGVVLSGLLPFLGDRRFYLADDNVSAWLPTSRRVGELLRSGDSHLMDPDLWRGGNVIGSARYGVWNPLVLVLDATVLQLDDLAVAMLLVTVIALVVLSVGVYVLAREYGATPWSASLAGVVLATGGWTLWMDAAWWTPHLLSLAMTPYVWIAARRLARGRWAPWRLIVAGAMCVTVGNPYSNAVVGAIVVGVAIEHLDRWWSRRTLVLLGSLAAIAGIALFVYLPFQLTADVGFRESGFGNNGWWSANLGQLLLASAPTATPFVPHFGLDVLQFPAVYASWFLLPLAPWIRWSVLRHRSFAGLGVVAGVFLVLALGPSDFWLFRWPLRLVPYLHLPIVVAATVALGRGLVTDRWQRRAAASAVIAGLGVYLSWAEVPDDLGWHVLAGAVVGVGIVAAVVVALRAPRLLSVALLVGTMLVLAVQLQFRPVNGSVSSYGLPTDASFYETNMGDRGPGVVVQVANFDAIPRSDRSESGAFADIVVGSNGVMAGLDLVNAYSGLGFTTHDEALCLRFDGGTCADAWNRLWEPVGPAGQSLADALGARVVVVQRTLIDTVDVSIPAGWGISEVTDHVVVWVRQQEWPYPESRLTLASEELAVDAATEAGPRREVVDVRRVADGPATLTFGRLVWPGYEAFVDGRPIPVLEGPAGLLVVEVPADVQAGEVVVTWSPPFWRRTLAVLALGVLAAIGTEGIWRWGRRRDRSDPPTA